MRIVKKRKKRDVSAARMARRAARRANMRRRVDQSTAIIPNLFTLANAFFGFAAIATAIEGSVETAILLIFAGMACDMLDGFVARLLKKSSQFGVEVDSLADVVTFGMAPSVIAYQVYFNQYELFGIFLSSMIMIFSIIRLAKFNVMTKDDDLSEKKMFIGIPTPVSAGTMITYVLFYHDKIFSHEVSSVVMTVLAVALPLLMVSPFKYDTFPGFSPRAIKANPAKYIVFFLAVFLIIITKGEASFSVFLFIISTGIFRSIISLFTKKGTDEEVDLTPKPVEPDKKD